MNSCCHYSLVYVEFENNTYYCQLAIIEDYGASPNRLGVLQCNAFYRCHPTNFHIWQRRVNTSTQQPMQRCSTYNSTKFAWRRNCQSNSHTLIGGWFVKRLRRSQYGAPHCKTTKWRGNKEDPRCGGGHPECFWDVSRRQRLETDTQLLVSIFRAWNMHRSPTKTQETQLSI